MTPLWAALVLVLCAEPFTAFIHRRNPKLPRFLLGRPPGGFLHTALYVDDGKDQRKEDVDSSIDHFTVEQPIDHENKALGTWNQRVQYNSKYFDSTAESSIVFLMIGGESLAPDIWISGERDYSYLRWAKKYGAAAFQLEHRFFGHSRPYNDMKTSSLKYCTMSQALEDTADFIRQMNTKYSFKNPKWVTFGGSYPGALNAWFRLKHSDLTVGAVASSALLGLKLDFFEYAIVVERTLRRTDPKCAEKVESAFDTIIKKALTVDGRKELSDVFKLNPAFNESSTKLLLDVQNFVSNLYSEFQGVVQYTYDGRNNATLAGLNARNLCAQVTNASLENKPLEQIKAVIDWEDTYYPEDNYTNSFPNSYDQMLDVLKNETFDDETDTDNAAARGWMWLCCNEIGFLQTTDQGKNIFGSMVPLNYYVDMCTDMFGEEVKIEYVRKNVIAAQKAYPGVATYNATNVILPSGNLDPWSAVGATRNDSSKHLYALVIDGTAHCADMYPIYDGEPATLAPARDMIQQEIEYYIGYVAPTKGASIPRPNLNSFFTSIAFVTLAVWMR